MPGSHSKKDKLKKKVAKVRKADQQDINRVKRWNSRSFNKKKELSGPTEPVFKTTATIKPLTVRPHPGMVGDELVANLRQRLAKIENYNAEADPEASAGEWINKYRKKRKNKIAKKKEQLNRHVKEYYDWEEIKKESYAEPTDYELEAAGEAEYVDGRRTEASKEAQLRKADGGVAPNYNNPSKIRKKKSATKAASYTEEDPNRVEEIDKFMKNSPLGRKNDRRFG